MGIALQAFDFYDLMDRDHASDLEVARRFGTDYLPIENLDTSQPALAFSGVYTEVTYEDSLSIMSAFRKDLFVSVTLPILGLGALVFAAVGGSYAYTLSGINRLDDSNKAIQSLVAEQSKLQAVAAEQITNLVKSSDGAAEKMDKVVEQLNQVNATLLVMKSQKGS